MNKLGTVIRYECVTSFKYIWIFYGCVFAAIWLFSAIVFISTGSLESLGFSTLEINSMVYVGILGVLGFQEDFKMLIQNGFTRKYIFLSTLSLFAFVSATMALVDTIIGNVLHIFFENYTSLFSGLYGNGHTVLINWLWLFLVYMLVCCLLYMGILVINKIGKKASVYTGIILVLSLFMIVPAVIKYVLPKNFMNKALKFLVKAIGFMADGSIDFRYPVLLFILLTGIIGACSYLIIRRTELKS